ncbi:MAG: hypothetical protein E6Q71_00700 [Pseudomonas sp.]|nr:MAG: hypothetical protein E6Q71_00700 [Pseudomonas sp.]
MSETTDMDEIERLIGSLGETLPEQVESSPDESPVSPTLAALETSRRPSPEVACGTCPNSVWFASPNEVKCYCRVMFLVTWSTSEQNLITHCDGLTMG